MRFKQVVMYFFYMLIIVKAAVAMETEVREVEELLSPGVALKEACTTWSTLLDKNVLQMDFTGALDAIRLLGNNKKLNNQNSKSVHNQSKMMGLFLYVAVYFLNNVLNDFTGNTKPASKEMLEKQKGYGELFVIAKAAQHLFNLAKIPIKSRHGDLIFYDIKCDERFDVGFLEMGDKVIPMVSFLSDGLMSYPMPYFYSNSLEQVESLSFKGKIVTDYGLFIQKTNSGPKFSIYNGEFTNNPFSRSHFSALWITNEDTFSTYCHDNEAIVDERGDFAFLSLYAGQAERLGFLGALNQSLIENPELYINNEGKENKNIIDNATTSTNDMPPEIEEKSLLIPSPEAMAFEEGIEINMERKKLIDQEMKELHKEWQNKKGLFNNKSGSKRRQNNQGNQFSGVDNKKLEEKAAKKIDLGIKSGEIKFNKFKSLLNKFKKCKLVSDQHGSHIVITNPRKTHATIVKPHSGKDSLPYRKVEKFLHTILESASK